MQNPPNKFHVEDIIVESTSSRSLGETIHIVVGNKFGIWYGLRLPIANAFKYPIALEDIIFEKGNVFSEETFYWVLESEIIRCEPSLKRILTLITSEINS